MVYGPMIGKNQWVYPLLFSNRFHIQNLFYST
jgi:hypothetical protein